MEDIHGQISIHEKTKNTDTRDPRKQVNKKILLELVHTRLSKISSLSK